MCIIIFHPANTPAVKKKTLAQCWKKNSDGAGYSILNHETKTWAVSKGFMSWASFWRSFNSHKLKRDSTWVAHFRIATSGNTDGGNTHPFPVCQNLKKMRAVTYTTKKIAYHNGRIGAGDGIFSDSMVHIQKYIAPLFAHITNSKFKIIIEKLCDTKSNRWLLTTGDKVYLLGDWETDKGVYYSNKGYIIYKIHKTNTDSANEKWWKKYDGKNITNYNTHTSAYEGYLERQAKKRQALIDAETEFEQTAETEKKVSCPICGEDHYVFESPYGMNECECHVCGAVFDKTTYNILFLEPQNF